MPIGAGGKVYARELVIEQQVLLHAALAVAPHDAHAGAQGAALDHLHRGSRFPGILAPLKGSVDVPGGLAFRPILVEVQGVGGLARGEHLAFGALIQQPGDAPFSIELQQEEAVLQAAGTHAQAGHGRGARRAQRQGRIAQRGH